MDWSSFILGMMAATILIIAVIALVGYGAD